MLSAAGSCYRSRSDNGGSPRIRDRRCRWTVVLTVCFGIGFLASYSLVVSPQQFCNANSKFPAWRKLRGVVLHPGVHDTVP